MADDKKVKASIDVLIDYKEGGLTFEQAVNRFNFLLKLEPGVAEQYIKFMQRDNVINFKKKNYNKKS
jgi:hypothetical protein